jgi:hypothetical protein
MNINRLELVSLMLGERFPATISTARQRSVRSGKIENSLDRGDEILIEECSTVIMVIPMKKWLEPENWEPEEIRHNPVIFMAF